MRSGSTRRRAPCPVPFTFGLGKSRKHAREWVGCDARPSPPRTPGAKRNARSQRQRIYEINGGEDRIRTCGELAPTHAFQACPLNRSGTSPRQRSHTAETGVALIGVRRRRTNPDSYMAERAGFEPAIRGCVYRFSRPAPSATQPSLRTHQL